MSTCQVVVEQKLNQLIQEFQDGKHEGSILTVATVESLAQDEKQTWRAIRKELEDIGISVAAFDANKDFIMSWFQEAILTGAFEEQNIVDDCEWHGLATSELKSTQSSPTDHMHFSLIDQDMGTIADPVLTTPGLALPYPRLPSKPMSDSRHSGLDEHSQEDIHETLSHNANALPKRRRPRIVTLFARLRGYNNSFIEACAPNLLVGDISDGALVKAADLLEKGADINALYNGNKAAMEWRNNTALDFQVKSLRGQTPLHQAVSGNLAGPNAERRIRGVVDLLISRGAIIDAEDDDKNTPLCLYLARPGSFVSVARLLLEHGADCNTVNWIKRTPLMQAAKNGREDMIRLLIEYRVKVSFRNRYSESALSIAVKGGNTAISSSRYGSGAQGVVKLMLEHGADINHLDSAGRTCLCNAVAARDADTARLLLDHGANPNNEITRERTRIPTYRYPKDQQLTRMSVLQLAIENKDTKTAKLLIERGANVNYMIAGPGWPMPILHLAISKSKQHHREIVDLMLKHGADLESKHCSCTALDLAVYHEDMRLALYLLEKGAVNNYAFFKSGEYWKTTKILKGEDFSEKVVLGYEKLAQLLQASQEK
ncbi:ankyrin [Acephala macrosclerotiorum]|nr:ankyrin [Acephala macrosclerotiorum]